MADDRTTPYGPNTAVIRSFLVHLAALGPAQRTEVVERYARLSEGADWHRAELALAEAVASSGRDELRDALAGPFLGLVRANGLRTGDDQVEPIAEPALAALLALLVRDLLPAETFAVLYAPFEGIAVVKPQAPLVATDDR